MIQPFNIPFSKQSTFLRAPQKKAFENIVGKGENAGNQHFLLFPTMFSSPSETEIITGKSFNLVKSKILLIGRELIVFAIGQFCASPRTSLPHNPFPNKFWTLPNLKSLQTTISNLTLIAKSSPNR